MTLLCEIAEIIKKSKSVLIFCHSRPDGDTIGCGTALKTALNSLNIKADLVCESTIPEKFNFIASASTYLKSCDVKDSYDLHVSVDCSVESMFKDAYVLYKSCEDTVNIDHHISNSRYAKYNYVEDRGACCEIVYELIELMGINISAEIADSLLLGICTDTGSFSHSNVTPSTLLIASKLAEKGGNLHKVNEQMFKMQPKERAVLYTEVISNMKYYLEDKLVFITITKQMLEKHNASGDMTEGFIDFPLSIKTTEVAVSLMEVKENCYKISFRSRGKVNVNEIASIYGGGGHILASGAMISGNYFEIIDKIVFDVKQRLD